MPTGSLSRTITALGRHSERKNGGGTVLSAPPPLNFARRAGNGTRTRDPNLGKVVLYQLSYSRTIRSSLQRRRTAPSLRDAHANERKNICLRWRPSGGEGNRTPDLLNAIQALSQLSYAPGTPLKTQNLRSHQEPRRIAEGISSVKKSGLAKRPSAGILHAAE